MTDPTKTIRTSFDLSREVSDRLNEHLAHGQKTQLMQAICEMVADAADQHGPMIIYLIVKKQVKFSKVEKHEIS